MNAHEITALPAVVGDEEFAIVVREYTATIRRLIARRLPDPAAVDDVLQETFLQAYRRWCTYDPAQPLRPWLATIAANLCWHRWRAAQRSAEAEAELLEEVVLPDYFGAAGSDEHVASLDRQAAVHVVLRGLNPRQRRMLSRWVLERRSTAALAASERVTPAVLKATVVRARHNFREQYRAVAGQGPFAGVLVGLGAVTARWRDRLTRLAGSGGWAEAAGAMTATPAMAVAGMAMITLMPAPSMDPRQANAVTDQPIAVVQEVAPAVPPPEGPPAPTSIPQPAVVQPPLASSPTSSTAVPVPAAAQPALTTNSRSPGGGIKTDNPAVSGWRTVVGVPMNCEAGMVGRATCKALDAAGQ